MIIFKRNNCLETMKKILYIGIFIILLFASERTLGGNSKNCIRFSYDNIVITSKYTRITGTGLEVNPKSWTQLKGSNETKF